MYVIREMKLKIFRKKKQYSYIKKPFAKNGWAALIPSIGAFGLTQGLLYFSVLRKGDVGQLYALLAVCAILFDIVGVAFGIAGMAEKEKNYNVVIICFVVEIVVLAEWVFVLLL